MHTIKLTIKDSVFDKVIYFLNNLPKDEVKIIEDLQNETHAIAEDSDETKVFSEHSANLIDDWKDDHEDEIWK